MVTRQQTTSPPPMPGNWDWRKEAWVKHNVSELALYIGGHIALAMRGDAGDDTATPQEIEDAMVFAILRPDITQTVLARPDAGDYVRYRVAHAIAQAIELCTIAYAKRQQQLTPEHREGTES